MGSCTVMGHAQTHFGLEDEEQDGFDTIDPQGGPGMPLTTYLPKRSVLIAKLEPSLTPSQASAAAVAEQCKGKGKGEDEGKGKGKDATLRTCIRMKEKRLDADLWRCDGVEYKGSHFPICVFTNNIGRRSPEKLRERAQRSQNKKSTQWSDEQEPRHYSRSRSEGRGQGQYREWGGWTDADGNTASWEWGGGLGNGTRWGSWEWSGAPSPDGAPSVWVHYSDSG